MNYEDEARIAVYTRQTPEFFKMGWDGRLVFWSLSCVADRRGVVRYDGWADLVKATDVPLDVLRAGLDKLISMHVVRLSVGRLQVVDYVEAQGAKMSWNRYNKEQRAKKAARAPADHDVYLGCVYAIRQAKGRHIKFGFSTNVDRRTRDLKTASASPIIVLALCEGTLSDEQRLHAAVSEHRAQGEWYKPSRQVLDIVTLMSDGVPIEDLIAKAESR